MRTIIRPASIACVFAFALASVGAVTAAPELRVGSKRFTESYILGEIIAQTAAARASRATHQPGPRQHRHRLDGARRPARSTSIPSTPGRSPRDAQARRQSAARRAERAARAARARRPRCRSASTTRYALAMRGDDARSARHPTLSDLASAPRAALGLSQEFLGRADGWPGLKRPTSCRSRRRAASTTASPTTRSRRARSTSIDVYSTDAKIGTLRAARARRRPRLLSALRRGAAVPRSICRSACPKTWAALAEARRAASTSAMIAMNAAAELDGRSFAAVADRFRRAAARMHERGQRPASAQRLSGAAVRPRFRAPDARASGAGLRLARRQHRHRRSARRSSPPALAASDAVDPRRGRRAADDSRRSRCSRS